MFENEEAFEVFESCRNQWRSHLLPDGRIWRDSLDRSAVVSTMTAFKVKDSRECLQKIRVMEAAAKEAIMENFQA